MQRDSAVEIGIGAGLSILTFAASQLYPAIPHAILWVLGVVGLALIVLPPLRFWYGRTAAVPDVPIHEAINHIVNDSKPGIDLPWHYTPRGFVVTDEASGEERLVVEHGYMHAEALRMIEERAISGELSIWGCRAVNAGTNPNRQFEDVVREITRAFWEMARLDPIMCFESSYRHAQTMARPGSGSVTANYTALMLNWKQLLRIWPRKSWLRRLWERKVRGYQVFAWDGSQSVRWPLFSPAPASTKLAPSTGGSVATTHPPPLPSIRVHRCSQCGFGIPVPRSWITLASSHGNLICARCGNIDSVAASTALG